MLTSIKFKHFKSYAKETTIDFTKKGALITGDMGTGKSTVLEIITLLIHIVTGDCDTLDLCNFPCTFIKSSNLIASYIFNIDNHKVEYSFTYQSKKHKGSELFKIDDVVIFETYKNKVINNDFCKISKNNCHTFKISNIKFNEDVVEFGEIYNKWKLFIINSISKFGSTSYFTFNDISTYNENKVINKFLRDNHLHISLTTKDDGQYVYHTITGAYLPFEECSLGERMLILNIASFLYCCENKSMLILDEFPDGLNSKTQQVLIKKFLENRVGSQIFIVSSNPENIKEYFKEETFETNITKEGSSIKNLEWDKENE